MAGGRPRKYTPAELKRRRAAQKKAWNRRNAEKNAAWTKAWRGANPEKVKGYSDRRKADRDEKEPQK